MPWFNHAESIQMMLIDTGVLRIGRETSIQQRLVHQIFRWRTTEIFGAGAAHRFGPGVPRRIYRRTARHLLRLIAMTKLCRAVFSMGVGIILTLSLNSRAAAEWHIQRLGTRTNFSLIAIGPDGFTHIIFRHFEQTFLETFDPQGRMKKKVSVPFQSFLNGLALAVDSENHLHLLYLANDTGALSYAKFDGVGWDMHPVPNPGCAPMNTMAVDSEQRIYIPCLWDDQKTGFGYASLIIFDGSAWTREDIATERYQPELQYMVGPAGGVFVAIDSRGSVHLGYGLSIGLAVSGTVFEFCESEQKPDGWVEHCDPRGYQGGSPFPEELIIMSMAVGPAGDPHFTYYVPNYTDWTVHYTHFDGATWSDELLPRFDPRYGGNGRLVVDSNDIPKTVFSLRQGLTSESGYYAWRASSGWMFQLVAGAPSLTNPMIVLDKLGLPHVGLTGSGGNQYYAVHAFLTEPDLVAQWEEIAPPVIKKGKAIVTGVLRVTNQGTASAGGFKITYLLSDKPVPDSSDPVIGKGGIGLPAGKQRLVKFSFRSSKSVSGKYLIAQITPKQPEQEANIDNNIAAAIIP